MSAKHDKPEVRQCHHCGHEWEPRVKNPKKCPQCQNPLWQSPRPKKNRSNISRLVGDTPEEKLLDAVFNHLPHTQELLKRGKKGGNEPTLTAPSEAAAPTPPTTDTNTAETDAAGADVPVETPIQRARREADERLRRLADAPVD